MYKHNSTIHSFIHLSIYTLSDVYLYISKVLFSPCHIKLTIYLYCIQRYILLCHFNFNSTISSSSSYNFPNKAPLYYYFVALCYYIQILCIYMNVYYTRYYIIHISIYIVFMCTQYIFFLLQFHKICNPFSAITALKHNNNGFVNYLYNRNLKTRDFRWNF